MSILFMMPNWVKPSEVWMQRMIEQLQDDISLIASENAESSWRGKIEGYHLSPDPVSNIWWDRAFRSIGFYKKSREEALVSLAHKIGIDKVVVNYATYAVKKLALIEKLNADVFIHCHGWDVAFDGCQDDPPHSPLHTSDYPKQLVEISKKFRFIANSNYTREKLISIGVNENRISLKYFGVEKIGSVTIKENKKVHILYLGRLIDCKGADIILKAFNVMRDNGFPAKLTIAGDGPLRVTCELLRQESKYMKDINIIGEVSRDKATELFSNSDIFTAHNRLGPITKREEAFGVSFIEAMSAGLPVVAGYSGGVPEIVLDGETGYLVDQNDIESHAKKLAELVSNPALRRKMGEAGRLRVAEHFNQEQEKNMFRRILGLST